MRCVTGKLQAYRDNNVARFHRFFRGGFSLSECTPQENEDGVQVDGVDGGSVVRQHCCERPTHDLRPVDDRNGLTWDEDKPTKKEEEQFGSGDEDTCKPG